MVEKTDSQQITDKLSLRQFAGLLAGILICIVCIAAVVSLATSTPYVDVMNVAGTLASISLSALLAYFYLRMSDIQSQQESLMAQQQEIMEAEHLPHIYVDAVSLSSENLPLDISKEIAAAQLGFTRGNLGRFSEDLVEITLINAGHGLAKDLRLNIEIKGRSEHGTVRFRTEVVKKPLSRYYHKDNISNDKQRSDGKNQEDFLESGETGQFWTYPEFPMYDGEEIIEVPFSIILELCEQRDVEEVDIKIELLYRDMTDETYREHINDGSVRINDIGRSTSLTDVFGHTDITDRSNKKEIGSKSVFYPDGFYLESRLPEEGIVED